MIILNNGPVPVRVAGRWLQPGENTDADVAVALRLMSANPDVVEPGKEPERQPPPVNVDKPTEDAPVVEAEPEIIEPSTAVPAKRKK